MFWYIFSVKFPYEIAMARTVRNGKIDTRSARAKLPLRREPYWTVVSAGCAIGYRKGVKGGTWVGRRRDDDGKQNYIALGAADDAREPNGDVLSFGQAQAKAREWFDRAAEPAAGPYTVADAVRDYLDWFGKNRKGLAFTRSAAGAFILPELGNVELPKLTKASIEEWLHKLADSPARLRTRRGEACRYREKKVDPEAVRCRKSTANRVLTILRAALNRAFADGKTTSDDAWRRVKPFRGVDVARIRYLTDDETRRLVNACDPRFRSIVQAALFTGMRYGELAALQAQDFNPDSGTVAVRQSKSGKPRHVVLTDEGREFFRSCAAGKPPNALLFSRPDGRAWGKSHQQRPLSEACCAARIAPAVSFHILRHTYASRLVMRGAPLAVVATQLGHSDTRMVEKHYSHLAPSYVADTVRAAFGTLRIAEPTGVVPLHRSR
jgi:integrase